MKLEKLGYTDSDISRTPHGVRGLKFAQALRRGGHHGRTPHGVRGLKYALHEPRSGTVEVAPLTGCVD